MSEGPGDVEADTPVKSNNTPLKFHPFLVSAIVGVVAALLSLRWTLLVMPALINMMTVGYAINLDKKPSPTMFFYINTLSVCGTLYNVISVPFCFVFEIDRGAWKMLMDVVSDCTQLLYTIIHLRFGASIGTCVLQATGYVL